MLGRAAEWLAAHFHGHAVFKFAGKKECVQNIVIYIPQRN